MYTHAITFTIDYNSTYSDRWDSLMGAIRRAAQGRIWTETTSFVLLKSARSAEDLLNTIYYGSDVNEALGDTLVVIDIASGDYAHKGVRDQALLASFFPSKSLGGLLGNALRR